MSEVDVMRLKHGLGPGPLTMRDFYRVCKGEGITVEQCGVASFIFYAHGRAFILLNTQLRGRKRRHAAFHELGHYFLHGPAGAAGLGAAIDHDKEAEADRFAEAATR